MIPECPWRFGEHYLVTDFIQSENVAIAEKADSFYQNGNNSRFVEKVAEWIKAEFYYPLDNGGNPAAQGQLLRHQKGIFGGWHFKHCVYYMWSLPNETMRIGCGICLVPETNILTQTCRGYNYSKIKDIKVGDYVMSHTGKLRQVIKTYQRDISEDLIVLHLENGEVIKITGNHPVYTTKGWVRASELTPEHILYKVTELATEGFFKSKKGNRNPNWHGGKQLNHCVICGSETYNKKCCSYSCLGKHSALSQGRKLKEIHPCQECGEPTIKPQFCSRLCSNNAKKGKNNPFYSKKHMPFSLVKMSETRKKQWADPNSNYNTEDGRSNHHRFPEDFTYDRNSTSNPNWKGGLSFEPYSPDFSRKTKEEIKNRDNYTCQLCGVLDEDCVQKLAIHHIDYDKKNTRKANLISLCHSCNSKVNAKRGYWQAFFEVKMAEKYAVQVCNGTKIISIEKEYYQGLVYNLEVEEDRSYSGRGLIFHNCVDTGNLVESLLRNKGMAEAWACLGNVKSASNGQLLGRHEWVECLYQGEPHVLETTIHTQGVANLIKASDVYNSNSAWAQQHGIYYEQEAKFNEKEYIGVGPLGYAIIQVMGLPMRLIELYGIDGTLKTKRSKLHKMWKGEEIAKQRTIYKAFAG